LIHSDIVSRVVLESYSMLQSDLWILFVRSQVVESSGWLSSWLWRFRRASWMTSDKIRQHCLACGAKLSSDSSKASYCSSKCRVRGFRSRKDSGFDPLEIESNYFKNDMESMVGEMDGFNKWYRKMRSMQVSPPDLLRVQHLPRMPARCGRCADHTPSCAHTDGSSCLYSSTCGGASDDRS